MRVAIGSDHAGFALRNRLAEYLRDQNVDVTQFGAPSEQSYDYPHASDEVATEVASGKCDIGVLVCGSGIGVCIRANRHPGVRAAQCLTVEMAKLARQHNHANVLCLGARILDEGLALQIADAFLATPEDHDPRHQRRVDLIERPLTP